MSIGFFLVSSKETQPCLEEGMRVDITSVLEELRIQRDILNQAILALENISTLRPRRRGRPRTNFHTKVGLLNRVAVSTSFHPKTMAAAN